MAVAGNVEFLERYFKRRFYVILIERPSSSFCYIFLHKLLHFASMLQFAMSVNLHFLFSSRKSEGLILKHITDGLDEQRVIAEKKRALKARAGVDGKIPISPLTFKALVLTPV